MLDGELIHFLLRTKPPGWKERVQKIRRLRAIASHGAEGTLQEFMGWEHSPYDSMDEDDEIEDEK